MFLKSLLSFCLLPLSLFAYLSGTYEVDGILAGTDQPYSGTVVIERQDDHIYTARWVFTDNSVDLGTGVRDGDALSFVFFEESTSDYGVQLYKIEGDVLKGPWVRYGATEKGFEKLKKIEHVCK